MGIGLALVLVALVVADVSGAGGGAALVGIIIAALVTGLLYARALDSH